MNIKKQLKIKNIENLKIYLKKIKFSDTFYAMSSVVTE